MSTLRFDGQVALVTGVSNFGLGLTYSRELAARGCKVVVNDLGRDWAGGANTPGVDEAVRLITEAGGTAVGAVGDVLTQSDEIVAAALDSFGRLDMVINNAGAGGDFDTLVDVHLRGSHRISEAAWPHLVASGNGRILNVASNGVFGSPAMPGYGAAKSGVQALTRTQAILGRPVGVRANVISPTAWTRSTAGIAIEGFAEFMTEHFPPEAVAAFALYLLHADTAISGEGFAVGGGLVSRLILAETGGAVSLDHRPEAWPALIDQVMDTSDITVPPTMWAELNSFVGRMGPEARAAWSTIQLDVNVAGKAT